MVVKTLDQVNWKKKKNTITNIDYAEMKNITIYF